jgi:O-succinylbenzoate synthase
MARAGVETAWWDLVAVERDATLAELVADRFGRLGVRRAVADTIRCGIALGIPGEHDGDRLASAIDKAIDAGYHRIKLKVDREWHVEAVRVAQRVLRCRGADIPLTVDANGAFRPEEDAVILRELDRMGLQHVEQPFGAGETDALIELARTQATPVCLDETLSDEPTARAFSQRTGKWVWNIKVQRVGGLEPATRMAAMAYDAGVPLWVGTMPESGLGAQAALALAAHDLFAFPTDVEPSDRWYVAGTDVVELEMGADGTMRVPNERPVVDPARFPLVHELRAGR